MARRIDERGRELGERRMEWMTSGEREKQLRWSSSSIQCSRPPTQSDLASSPPPPSSAAGATCCCCLGGATMLGWVGGRSQNPSDRIDPSLRPSVRPSVSLIHGKAKRRAGAGAVQGLVCSVEPVYEAWLAVHFLHFASASQPASQRRLLPRRRLRLRRRCRMAPTRRLHAAAALLSFLCLHGLLCDSGRAFAQSHPVLYRIDHVEENDDSGSGLMPELSPSGSPKPLVPFLAPAPLAPFFNNTTPKLSGKCSLNFTAVDDLMTTTAVDCFASFAPFLANVICCPQLQATLTILIGQSSKQTGSLALDPTVANYCLSDVQQLLLGQGASDDLHSICSVHLSNVTEGSCPVSTVDVFESIIDSSKLLEACRKVDPVNECCSQTCQNTINEAAQKISLKDGGLTSYTGSPKVDSCRNVVLRWLSSRLDPSSAKQMLRQISNCNVNGVCPLSFPDTSKVAKECGGTINNSTSCCKSLGSYVAHLQKQSFITNLQALDCASFLGTKLQKMNVSMDVYSSCQITLKDFSLQVGSQESGCLLPSMPSDASFDPTSGISFTCDLNDNIAAPWPSSLQASSSSCNKSVNIPERPSATSAQNGVNQNRLKLSLLISFGSLLVALLLQV